MLITEDHDGLLLVFPARLPWGLIFAVLTLVFFPIGLFLFVTRLEAHPRMEVRLTADRLSVRSGWLRLSERAWALPELEQVDASEAGVGVTVAGVYHWITPALPPDEAETLALRILTARRTAVGPDAPPLALTRMLHRAGTT